MLWGAKPGLLSGRKGGSSGTAFEVGVCWVPVSDPLGEFGTISPSPSTPLPAMPFPPRSGRGKSGISLKHPGLGSYSMTQSYIRVKSCSCMASFKMQISLQRTDWHIHHLGGDGFVRPASRWLEVQALGLEGWPEGPAEEGNWEGIWEISLCLLPH